MKQPIFTIENNSFYIEDIFVEYDGPVFFMCKDKYNARYFVEAGPSNEKEAQWVLVKASDNRINDALNNKITLYDLFRNAEEKSVLLITTSSTLVDSSEYVPASQVSDALLPSPGYYLDADRGSDGKRVRIPPSPPYQ